MADLLQAGVTWLRGKMRDHISRNVTYKRGANEVVVAATVGKTLLKISDGFSTKIEWTDRDYLIGAADLILSGSVTLPRRGDKIIEVQGATTYTYEVLAPGNEPPWRWADGTRLVLRIHAKQVGVA